MREPFSLIILRPDGRRIRLRRRSPACPVGKRRFSFGDGGQSRKFFSSFFDALFPFFIFSFKERKIFCFVFLLTQKAPPLPTLTAPSARYWRAGKNSFSPHPPFFARSLRQSRKFLAEWATKSKEVGRFRNL